ncbi:MAG: flippase [Steroidobacteraceae bacterium]
MRTKIRALRNLIAERPQHREILTNIGWLMFDKILRLLGGVFVAAWVARYLGPAAYGQYSYVIAFSGLFINFASLGLNSLIVRDLVWELDSRNEILGTALFLQIASGICAALLSMIGADLLDKGADRTMLSYVLILSPIYVLKATETIKYWFESRVRSVNSVLIEDGVYILMIAARVFLIKSGAGVAAFIYLTLFEAALTAVALVLLYSFRIGSMLAWSVNSKRSMRLVKDAWPMLLSSVAIAVYMRIDQVMLGFMSGESAVGIYTAAVRISELWYVIPTAIVGSVFPSVLATRASGDLVSYRKKVQFLLSSMASISVAISVLVTIFANTAVTALYGKGYEAAANVLRIHIWAGVFVFTGTVGARWYVSEGLQRFSMLAAVVGAVINVALNLVLIPSWGALGAAIATIISYGIATYLMDFFLDLSRPMFFMKTRALLIFGSKKGI